METISNIIFDNVFLYNNSINCMFWIRKHFVGCFTEINFAFHTWHMPSQICKKMLPIPLTASIYLLEESNNNLEHYNIINKIFSTQSKQYLKREQYLKEIFKILELL